MQAQSTTSPLEYKLIAPAEVTSNGRWRCKSAASEVRARVDLETEWGDTCSLPGQLSNGAAPLHCHASAGSQRTNEECTQLHTGTSSAQDVASYYGYHEEYHTAATASLNEHSILEMEQGSLHQDTRTPSPSSPVQTSSTLLITSTLANPEPTRTYSNSSLSSTLLAVVCAVVVYPVLLVCLPLLLAMKLLSLLCCCIPCLKCGAAHSSGVFQATKTGGYYFTLIELNERMTSERFARSVLSSMSAERCEEVVTNLTSRIRSCVCFSWLESNKDRDLSQHITIMQNQISTVNDVAYFICKLSNQVHDKASSVYFFLKYKHKSAVLVQTHHSVLNGGELKKTLIELFAHSRLIAFEQPYDGIPTSSHDRPSTASVAFRSPAILFKHLLHSSNPFSAPFGKINFAFSKEVSLSHVHLIAKKHGCSLEAVCLACLTAVLRVYLQGRGTASMSFAIPVSIGSSVSAYFVQLPLSSEASFSATVRNFEEQILLNKSDALSLHSAGRLGSTLLPQCMLNSLTRAVLKQAGGIFTVTHCSRDPLFIDGVPVASICGWPPLFQQFAVGVSVLCYGGALRLCVATDRLLCEWPDVLVSMFLQELNHIAMTD